MVDYRAWNSEDVSSSLTTLTIMAVLQLIRILDGVETVLEETPVPETFDEVACYYSHDHIRQLERHYERTGKPKKGKIDVLYLTRLQVERM